MKKRVTYGQRLCRWLCKGRRKTFNTVTESLPFFRQGKIYVVHYPTTVYVVKNVTVTVTSLSWWGALTPLHEVA